MRTPFRWIAGAIRTMYGRRNSAEELWSVGVLRNAMPRCVNSCGLCARTFWCASVAFDNHINDNKRRSKTKKKKTTDSEFMCEYTTKKHTKNRQATQKAAAPKKTTQETQCGWRQYVELYSMRRKDNGSFRSSTLLACTNLCSVLLRYYADVSTV